MFQETKPLQSMLDQQDGDSRVDDETEGGAWNLASTKRAFTTRRATFGRGLRLITGRTPAAGDLVVARVTSLVHHQKLESPCGRRAQLYHGDTILVAYGERYAPDQFEAVIPDDLGPCELVAGGGVAGKVLNRHSRVRRPTSIRPLGLLADSNGRRVNLADFALPQMELPQRRPRVIAVAGTSMNAGKTTTAAALIHGLARAGLRVAATKVTGTGSGNDFWRMLDAGARTVLDFTDMGHATTAGLAIADVEHNALSLIAHCSLEQPDVIVMEIADGLLQKETAGLLASVAFRSAVDGILFAAQDAMGALSGRDWLGARGYNVIGVSGLLTASPLAAREAGEAIDEPIIGVDELQDRVRAPIIAFGTSRDSARLRACA